LGNRHLCPLPAMGVISEIVEELATHFSVIVKYFAPQVK
jgi:hypothetical protein